MLPPNYVNYEEQGDEYLQKAEKELIDIRIDANSVILPLLLPLQTNSCENAKNIYIYAAKYYKIGKLWNKSADTYQKATQCERILQRNPDSLTKEAALCLQNANLLGGVKLLRDLCLKQINCMDDEAIETQGQIAECYLSQKEYSLASSAFLEAARLSKYFEEDISDINEWKMNAADAIIMSGNNLIDALRIYKSVQESTDNIEALLHKAIAHTIVLIYLALDDADGAKQCQGKFKYLDRYIIAYSECLQEKSISKFEILQAKYGLLNIKPIHEELLIKISELIKNPSPIIKLYT